MVDFCYLHVPGGGTREILVLYERASGLVGFIAMQDNRESVKAEVKRWFELAGLSGPSSATVIVRTDAQQSLAVLMKSSVACQVQSAAPQHHELVGGAERSVRNLKEQLSTLRSDLQAQGWDIRFDPQVLWYVCRYVAFVLNFYRCVHGSDKTPVDIIVGQKRKPPAITMFGATVFAEVPESVEAPAGTRFVPAAFLGPPLYSRGILVCAVVGHVHDTQAKVFMAKSVKVLNKITFDSPMCSDYLVKVAQIQPHPQPAQHPPMLPDPADPPPEPPKIGKGPPADWLRRHGRTAGCNGCARDYLGGRQHSVACRKRYQDWYDAQQRPAGVQPQGGMPDIAQQADNDPRVPPPALIGDMPPAPVNVPPELSAPIDPSGLKPVKPDQASSPKVRINVKSPPNQVQLQAPPSPRSGPQVRKIEQVPDVDMEVADVSASSSASPQAPGHPAVPGGSEDMDVSRLTQAWEDINQPRPDTTINSLLTRFTEPPPEGESDRPLMPFYIPKVGEKMVCKPHQLCGRKVFLVEPNLVKSEDNSESLNISDAVKARKIEMDAMSEVRFGEVIDQQAALAYCQKHGIKPISTRWVVNPKVIEGKTDVRARMVVQQVKSGQSSAWNLGISSSTPSLEAVRAILTQAHHRKQVIQFLDVSTAFLHSDLPKGYKVCIRLPQDVSLDDKGVKPAFAVLTKAVNGLRIASKAWLNLVDGVCGSLRLHQSATEPCVYSGWVQGHQMTVLIYVDDIVVAANSQQHADLFKNALLKKVRKVKETGFLPVGSYSVATFLARTIERDASGIYIRVPPSYLQEELKDLTASAYPPDLVKELDERPSELGDQPEYLNESAASRYRATLGRVAWWIQTRPDLGRYASVLAQGQANPTTKFEKGLVKFLKFIKSQVHFYQKFPAENLKIPNDVKSELVTYCDSSWGSSNAEMRKSCAGYVIVWKNCPLKLVSRLQTSVALSSCESETIGLLYASQETLGIRHLVTFLDSCGEINSSRGSLEISGVENDQGAIATILTDSSSARALTHGSVTRRTRHLSIAVAYLQNAVQCGLLVLYWIGTNLMNADILTKCLSKDNLRTMQDRLGFIEMKPPEIWQFASKTRPKQLLKMFNFDSLNARSIEILKVLNPGDLVIYDICSEAGFGLAPLYGQSFSKNKMYVLQITKDDDLERCADRLVTWTKQLKFRGVWVWSHFSPPCTGGSPMQYLQQSNLDARLRKYHLEFARLLKHGKRVLQHADIRTFELSRHCSYWREPDVQALISDCELSSCGMFDRCAYVNSPLHPTNRHTFRIQANIPFSGKRRCRCESHLPLDYQRLREYGLYPKGLVSEFKGHVVAWMDSW